MIPITTFILCGGFGTRLRPVVSGLPKVLAPVAGQPFLFYLLSYLSRQGIFDVVLCTGYAADQVREHCGDGSAWDLQIRYSHEAEPRGTGGAVKHAQPLLAAERCLVLNGDSLILADLPNLVEFHSEKQAQVTMVLTEVQDRQRFGSVLLAEDRAIAGFYEKGQGGTGLINAGIYLLERAVLQVIPEHGNISLERDVFPTCVGQGMYGQIAAGPFIDIGTPETYADAQTLLAGWTSTQLQG